MADTIKQTQKKNSDARKYLDGGVARDIITPQNHVTVPTAIGGTWHDISPKTTSGHGGTIKFEFTEAAHVGEVFVDFQLDTPTGGTYCNYPALALISRVRLKAGSDTIHEYDFKEVFMDILSQLDESQLLTVRGAAGGVGLAAGANVAVPIPLFWTPIANKMKKMNPFPAHLLGHKLTLELDIRPLADIMAVAGVGNVGIEEASMWYKEYVVDDSVLTGENALKGTWRLKSVDWQTIDDQAIVAATNTTFDLSELEGNVTSLSIQHRDDTDLQVTHLYYALSDINNYTLTVNGKDILDCDNHNASSLQSFFDGDFREHVDQGNAALIAFGFNDYHSKVSSHVGGLYVTGINSFKAKDVNGSANGQVSFAATREAYYTITSNGYLKIEK